MPPLYLESQWRAIERIESMTKTCYRPIAEKKRIFGPAFLGGEFFIYVHLNEHLLPHRGYGPPRPTFRVVEEKSGLSITGTGWTKGDQLKLARMRIEVIGEHWPGYLAAAQLARIRAGEKRAATEADAAIARAKSAKPRKVSARARAVFDASQGRCHYCGTPLTLDGKWHIEHKVPRALFGGSEQSNLTASCTTCNHAKRDKTDLEFMASRPGSSGGHAAGASAAAAPSEKGT